MSDALGEAVRAGACAALRQRIEAAGRRAALGTTSAQKDGVWTEFRTSEGALAARLLAEFEAIARDIETMELQA